jgi:hypothetical protein
MAVKASFSSVGKLHLVGELSEGLPVSFKNDGSLTVNQIIEEDLALKFNSASTSVIVPNTGGRLKPTQQTTWELWFRIDPALHNQYDALMGFYNNAWDIRMDGATSFTCHTYDTAGNFPSVSYIPSPYSLLDGEWHHIAMVWDGLNGQRRSYVDGVQTLSANFTPAMPSDMGNYPLSIGAVQTGTSRNMAGNIRDVRIWNTARTAQQIQDNFNSELQGNEAGLVANYKLREGSGTIANDSSTNNYDGSIANGVWQGVHGFKSDGTLSATEFVEGAIVGAIPVTWKRLTGVTVDAENTLVKTGSEGWNAGAVSEELLIGNGYVETTVGEITSTSYRMCGLSTTDSNNNYMSIDYAIYPAGAVVNIYEYGSNKGAFGSIATGDKLRITVQDGVVSYQKNGATFYTSTTPATLPLMVDTTLYNTNNTLKEVILAGAWVGAD